MKPWQHISVSVVVLVLSQIGYYYAFLSNQITIECYGLSEVKRCDNPYLLYFDVFKSGIQLFLASVWTVIGFKIVKSAKSFAIAFFWVFSVWNEFADYLWGEQYIFKTDEWINLVIGCLASIILFLIWRKKLIAQ